MHQEDEKLNMTVVRALRKSTNIHLEHMKRFELNVFALVPEEVHHHLEVRLVRYVPCHNVEVGSIEENFAQELQGLPLRYVVS